MPGKTGTYKIFDAIPSDTGGGGKDYSKEEEKIRNKQQQKEGVAYENTEVPKPTEEEKTRAKKVKLEYRQDAKEEEEYDYAEYFEYRNEVEGDKYGYRNEEYVPPPISKSSFTIKEKPVQKEIPDSIIPFDPDSQKNQLGSLVYNSGFGIVAGEEAPVTFTLTHGGGGNKNVIIKKQMPENPTVKKNTQDKKTPQKNEGLEKEMQELQKRLDKEIDFWRRKVLHYRKRDIDDFKTRTYPYIKESIINTINRLEGQRSAITGTTSDDKQKIGELDGYIQKKEESLELIEKVIALNLPPPSDKFFTVDKRRDPEKESKKIQPGATFTIKDEKKIVSYVIDSIHGDTVIYHDTVTRTPLTIKLAYLEKMALRPNVTFIEKKDVSKIKSEPEKKIQPIQPEEPKKITEIKPAVTEREKKMEEIGQYLAKLKAEGRHIDTVVIHGYTYENEEGELGTNWDADYDTRGALRFLGLAGVEYDSIEKTHKGGMVPHEKGKTYLYLDTSGEPVGITKEDGVVVISNDHHQEGKPEVKSSATAQQYEMLVRGGLLAQTESLDLFAKVVTAEDNLTYVDQKWFNEEYFQNEFAQSIFALHKEVAFDESMKWFENGKDPVKPEWTKNELETKVHTGKILTAKNGTRTPEILTLKEIIARAQAKVDNDLRNFVFAEKMMDKNGLKKETAELGKIFYNTADYQKDGRSNRNNRINYPFHLAKAKGFDTYIGYSDNTKKLFVNTTTKDLSPTTKAVQAITPEANLVSGVMIQPPRKMEDRKVLTRELVWKTLKLKDTDALPEQKNNAENKGEQIMNINYRGRVVPIEIKAFDVLKQYDESMKTYFAAKDEILSDIEERVSELLQEHFKKGLTRIGIDEINQVIDQLGKPEDVENKIEKEKVFYAIHQNLLKEEEELGKLKEGK